jgi:acetyl-CoA acetyltransferase
VSNPGVIIAGAAETDEIGRLPNISTLGLHIEAARNAVADAGLTMRDIDGIASVSAPGPVQVAHALGIYPDWIDGTGVGGTSFLLHVRHAVAAIRAGYAKTILITHGESGRSRVGAPSYRLDLLSPAGKSRSGSGRRRTRGRCSATSSRSRTCSPRGSSPTRSTCSNAAW